MCCLILRPITCSGGIVARAIGRMLTAQLDRQHGSRTLTAQLDCSGALGSGNCLLNLLELQTLNFEVLAVWLSQRCFSDIAPRVWIVSDCLSCIT